MANYLIKVVKSIPKLDSEGNRKRRQGIPLEEQIPQVDALVEIPEIGCELTDDDGLATIVIPGGAPTMTRGLRLAARDGKSAGPVKDLGRRYYVHVFAGGHSGGYGLVLLPDVETVVELT